MKDLKPTHQAQTLFPCVDGCLQVGGVPITRLAQRVGSTPFYAYDRALLTQRVAHLRGHMPAGMRLHYSIKANPMAALVQHMAGLVDGLDVASGGELKIALDSGVQGADISFAGPGKTVVELAQAVASGACIVVESAGEIERLACIADQLGIRARVMVRVNPDFELKYSGLRMGGGAKPFGIDAEMVPHCLERIAQLHFNFLGFHLFSGSQSLNADAIIDSHCKAVELACRLAAAAPQQPRALNLGGGLGIAYFAGETALDLTPIGDNLRRLMADVARQLPSAQVAIELGRYLVGEAGVYVARIVDKKISRGKTFLVSNGGLHHHLAASGNFGQVIRKNYPVVIGNKMGETARETCTVVGPLCTPLDIIADNVALPPAEVDDLVVVFQSGAYGMTASPIHFLGHPVALEVLV